MTGTPIACTLSADQLTTRMENAGALTQRALLDIEPTRDGARFDFAGHARANLEALIEAESKCCSFLRFKLVEESDKLRLTVEGPAEARPLIFELFGVAEPEAVAR